MNIQVSPSSTDTPLFSSAALRALIIPLLIDQLLNVCVGIADTFMVSVVGETAVSAVSLVDTLNMLFLTIFSGLATGGAVVCAQFTGQKNMKKAKKSASQLLLSAGLISVICMLFCLIFSKGLLRLAFGSIEDTVMHDASLYFFVIALSLPALALYNSGAALFRSIGNSKVPMSTSLFMNLLNIIGNAVLLYGFHMGVLGVAIPTLISRIFAAVLMFFLLRSRKLPICIRHSSWCFDFAMIRKILSIGIPNGLETGIFQIGKILVLGMIATLGTTAITANAIANTISTFQALAEDAISLALLTVIGQCAGASAYDQARTYTRRFLRWTYELMWVVNLPILFAAPLIAGLFHLSTSTLPVAVRFIRYNCLFALTLWPLAFSLPNVMRACADVRYPLLVSMLSMWTFRVLLCWIIVHLTSLGLTGIYLCFGIDWIVRAICFVLRYRSRKWIPDASSPA